jgi:hypothetical protein
MNDAARRALLVGVGAYILLTILSFSFGELYVAALLPVLKIESQWLSFNGLLCDSLTLVTRNARHLVQLRSVTTMEIGLENGALAAGAALRSTTLQAYVLCHPVVVYTVLAAWPVASWRSRIELLLWGIPCVLIITSLDIPFVLCGSIRDVIFGELAPERVDADPLILYFRFMDGGGRFGLAIVAALVTVLCVARARSAKLRAYGDAQSTQKQSPQLHIVSTKASPR